MTMVRCLVTSSIMLVSPVTLTQPEPRSVMIMLYKASPCMMLVSSSAVGLAPRSLLISRRRSCKRNRPKSSSVLHVTSQVTMLPQESASVLICQRAPCLLKNSTQCTCRLHIKMSASVSACMCVNHTKVTALKATLLIITVLGQHRMTHTVDTVMRVDPAHDMSDCTDSTKSLGGQTRQSSYLDLALQVDDSILNTPAMASCEHHCCPYPSRAAAG